MNDINRHLRAADPIGHEPGPTPDAVAELRRVVISAAQAPARTAFPKLIMRTAAVAAAVTLMVGAGAVVNRRAQSVAVNSRPVPAPQPAAVERTQVQFSTPGGTRIVWTIDPSFEIKGNR